MNARIVTMRALNSYEKIITVMTEKQICDILKQYSESELSGNKKRLICNFLLSKLQLLKVRLYFELLDFEIKWKKKYSRKRT